MNVLYDSDIADTLMLSKLRNCDKFRERIGRGSVEANQRLRIEKRLLANREWIGSVSAQKVM